MDKEENNLPRPINSGYRGFSSPPDALPTPVPVLTPPPFEPSPDLPIAPTSKPKKKGLLIGLIVAAVIIVLCGGSALAYNFWYQNPDKVVTDGIINAIKAKSIKYTGSAVTTGDQPVKIEVSGRGDEKSHDLNAKVTFKYEDKAVTLEGALLIDAKGDLYLKVRNIDTLINQYRDAQDNAQFKQLIDDVVSKVNDQWIKVNADDLKSFSETSSKSQKCFTEAVKKIESDKAVRSELADTYKKHKFIIIDDKLGSQNGSLGYKLHLDSDVAKVFTSDLRNTQFYKAMQDCDKDFKINENDLFKESKNSDKTETSVELWVSRFSHQITKLNIEEDTPGKGKATIVFEPTFDTGIDAITTPEESTTIKQLQSDFEALFQSAIGSTRDTTPSLFDEDISSEL